MLQQVPTHEPVRRLHTPRFPARLTGSFVSEDLIHRPIISRHKRDERALGQPRGRRSGPIWKTAPSPSLCPPLNQRLSVAKETSALSGRIFTAQTASASPPEQWHLCEVPADLTVRSSFPSTSPTPGEYSSACTGHNCPDPLLCPD